MHFPCLGLIAKAITSPETVYPERRPPSNGTMQEPKGGTMFGDEEFGGGRNRRPIHDRRIKSILQAIESNPASDVTGLTAVAHLSSSRLSHLFKHEVGCSLYGYLADRRLEKAAQLLRTTDTPVKEVSYIVGYRHSPSFVRAFREKFGCTPNDLRNGVMTKVAIAKDSRFG